MARATAKRTTKVTTIKREDGDQASITTTQPAESYMPKLSSVEEKRDEQFEDELEEQRAANVKIGELRMIEKQDQMGTWLKNLFRLASFPVPMFKYKDSRFPLDDKGHRMTVKRFYPSLSLVVDSIPASWTEEMIMAKKWACEKAGLHYVWQQEGEIIRVVGFAGEKGSIIQQMVIDKGFNEGGNPVYENFWNRYDKLKKAPSFLFSMEPFSFEANIIKGVKS